MRTMTRWVGAVSIVAGPVCFGIGDQLRMAASEDGETVGIVQEWGREQAVAQTETIAANLGLFGAAAWLNLVAVLLAAPALLTIWRLSVGGSRRWAWTGAALAMVGILGQVTHLVGYYGLQQAYAATLGGDIGWQVDEAVSGTPYVMVLFVPYFLALLAPLPQAVGLRRARVIPVWAMGALIVGVLLFAVAGSSVPVSLAWMVLMVVGFAPAALAAARADDAHARLDASTQNVRV